MSRPGTKRFDFPGPLGFGIGRDSNPFWAVMSKLPKESTQKSRPLPSDFVSWSMLVRQIKRPVHTIVGGPDIDLGQREIGKRNVLDKERLDATVGTC